jgi:phage tail-like protein
LIEGLPNPLSLADLLPAMLQDDPFVCRLAAGLDDVLAPLLLVLDNLDSYLDPGVAPPDFLGWLADCLGLALDENWPLARQRALVAGAVELYRAQGTSRALAANVALYTGSDPEIEESGGCDWSLTPNSPLPGDADLRLVVRVPAAVAGTEGVDLAGVERIVATSKPAHVPHRVEVAGT